MNYLRTLCSNALSHHHFNVFLVLHGVQGNANEAVVYFRYVPSLVKRKTPLAVFLIRKV